MTALIVLLLLWVSVVPAQADPGTIGLLVLTAVSAAEVATVSVIGTITVAQVIGTAVIVAGSIALQYALSPNQTPKPQEGQQTTRQTVPPRRRNYGRVKVSGPLMFSETTEEQARRRQVMAINHGEIDAIEEHWLSEFLVTLASPAGGSVTDYYLEVGSGGGGQCVYVEFRLGTASQIAYADLISFFPDLWTSAHQGNGIAHVLVRTQQPFNRDNFTATFPGGLPPPYRAVIRASKVWDPRDEAQDKDTPSTWTWTQNPVLIALDFHRHHDGMGLAVYDDVYFSNAAITEDWIPAADICEEDVGGVPRYVCSGGYVLPADTPASVLEAIFATCDGQPYERSDGAIGIRVGKTVAPTVFLDDEHILGYDSFKKGDNVFLACNEVTAKYTSPDHDFQEEDADPWRDEADIAARGQEISKPLNLQWVTNHSQARRLMKINHARFNPEWQGTIVTDFAGFAVRNERYVHLTIAELGIDRDFELTSFDASIGDQAVTCSIGVTSIDQSAYDWDEETEAGTPPPVPEGVLGEGEG